MRDAHYNWKGLKLTTIIEDDVLVSYVLIMMGGIKLGTGKKETLSQLEWFKRN